MPEAIATGARHGENNRNEVVEYVLRRIMRHVETPEGMKYVVRSYGYGPQNDPVDSAA